MEASARAAADSVVAKLPLTPGCTLEHLRTEDAGEKMKVVYKKVFATPTKEVPAQVTVLYDKKTGSTQIVREE